MKEILLARVDGGRVVEDGKRTGHPLRIATEQRADPLRWISKTTNKSLRERKRPALGGWGHLRSRLVCFNGHVRSLRVRLLGAVRRLLVALGRLVAGVLGFLDQFLHQVVHLVAVGVE